MANRYQPLSIPRSVMTRTERALKRASVALTAAQASFRSITRAGTAPRRRATAARRGQSTRTSGL